MIAGYISQESSYTVVVERPEDVRAVQIPDGWLINIVCIQGEKWSIQNNSVFENHNVSVVYSANQNGIEFMKWVYYHVHDIVVEFHPVCLTDIYTGVSTHTTFSDVLNASENPIDILAEIPIIQTEYDPYADQSAAPYGKKVFNYLLYGDKKDQILPLRDTKIPVMIPEAVQMIFGTEIETQEGVRVVCVTWLDDNLKPDISKLTTAIINSYHIMRVGNSPLKYSPDGTNFYTMPKTIPALVNEAIRALNIKVRSLKSLCAEVQYSIDNRLMVQKVNDPVSELTVSVHDGDYYSSADFKPVDWLIDDVLSDGLAILYAEPKVGKTWMAMDIAAQIAAGGTFLGKKCHEADVFYLDFEGTAAQFQRRIHAMGYNKENPFPKRVHVMHDEKDKVPRLDSNFDDFIKINFLKKYEKPRLVVVDMYSRIAQEDNGKRDAYNADAIVLSYIHEFCKKNHVCMLMLDHKNKSGTLQGSVSKFGQATTMIEIAGSDGEENHELKINCRDGEGSALMVHFNRNNCTWICDGTIAEIKMQEAEDKFANDPVRRAIERGLEENGGTFDASAKDLSMIIRDNYGEEITPNCVGKRINELREKMYSRNAIITTCKRTNSVKGLYTFRRNEE